jgi:hypothetical protein
MRSVRAAVLGGVFALALLVPGMAQADTSIEAAPGRQYAAEDGITKVYVANTGDTKEQVTAEPMVLVGQDWQPAYNVVITPSSFTLKAHTQALATVVTPSVADADCRVYGAGFTIESGQVTETGVLIEGQVMSQVVVKGATATEQTCLAALPTGTMVPPVAGAHAVNLIPFYAGGGLGLILIVAAWRWRKRVPKTKARKGSAYGW